MAKNSRGGRKNRGKKPAPEEAKPTVIARVLSVLKQVPTWVKAVLASLLAIPAVIKALDEVVSPPTISLLDPVLTEEPLSSPILVSNRSLLPIYDVSVMCTLNHVEGLLRLKDNRTGAVVDTPSVVEGMFIETLDTLLPDFPILAGNESVTVP